MPDDTLDHVKPYLDEIADRLWSNNAAVMVGAGFSRNSNPVNSTSPSFPSWQELGNIFYRRLHGRFPGKEARYLSLLKLAEQIEAAFGRPALNNLLRRAIPDGSYEPSPLHSQLLNLPWKDVFTTNYDTLLERARASVTLRHYDVVATEGDLLYANAPRIVKLHGSFRSGPFVITEEDYRRYPHDHAPFVNTVRQSLLENTLCLIGFSGDDPNFLQWIGWIRDQFGQDSAPNIYLIGVFDALTEADRRLLDRRGIVAVDLSAFSLDHGGALGAFLDYLKDRKTRAADWPIASTDVQSWATEADPRKYPEVATEWRRQRGEYPGWVVMPEDRRRFLWRSTVSWLSLLSRISQTDRAELETPLDLDLAFELAWRLDRCLFPLTGELPAFLEEVAAKYGDATLPLPEKAGWTRTSVFEAVANLRLWLLRHYREEGLVEEWQGVRRAIEADFGRLLPEHRARFRLEEALHALFRFDPAEAKRLLVNWQSNDTLPFWEAKRATLMAELGEVEAAHSILESSLSAIRQQLGLNPIIEDFTLVSQESVVMLLLWAVERGKSLRVLDSEDGNLLDELSERWNELTRYRCDPRREIASLSARLRHRSEGRKQETKTHSFDLGMVSRTIHFGFDEEAVAAYGLLRLYEDIGMPCRLEHATFDKAPIESTLHRIRSYSPHWALVNIVRLGDAKAADGLFDREYLSRLGRDEVDGFFEVYLPALERTIAMVNEPDQSVARTFELLAKTLPEVFSRLCYKCSPGCRERLVGVLAPIYSSKRRGVFAGVDRFADRLFDSMSVEERARAVPSLIDFPMPDDLGEIEKREFVNPVLLIDQPGSVRGEALPVTPERIDELLDRLASHASDREWTATKLVWLHDRDKLSEPQSKRLGELLWDGVKPPGVPVVMGYYSFVCMKFPHPKGIDAEPRVKDQLRSIIDERMQDSRFDKVLDELRYSAGIVGWSRAEAMELVATLSEWWNENKHWLHHRTPMPFGAPADNTKRTTSKAVDALSSVISHLPADQSYEEGSEPLREFLANLGANDIPVRRLEAAAMGTDDERREGVIERVTAAMFDNDEEVVIDALMTARVLARAFSAEGTHGKFAPVGAMLVQGIQWRYRPALADRLRVATDLVKNQPWFLTEEALTGLGAGLGEIAEETTNGVKGNDQDGVIAIRAAAASLAFTLFEYCQESGSDEREAILHWRELCSNPDEFSEIKHSWNGVGS